MSRAKFRVALVFLLLFGILTNAFFLLALPVQAVTWCDDSWSYRKAITISNTNVDEDLTDFPLLISTTDADLATNASSTALDIFFVEADKCSTKLKWEKESYDSATGELVAWVKVPTVDADANTTLHMYYGNSNAADQTDAANVWDTNYKGAWHLPEDPSGTAPQMLDSTSNNNDGTSAGSMTSGDQVAGQIDGSLDFDGSDDYVDVGSGNDTKLQYPMSITAWMNMDQLASTKANAMSIVARDHPGTAKRQFEFRVETTDKFNFTVYPQGTSTGQEGFRATAFTSNDVDRWIFVAATVDASRNVTVYVDGASDGSGTISDGTIPTVSLATTIGEGLFGDYNFDGTIDEVRISSVARSAAWIKFSYHSQKVTSGTLTFGSQVTKAIVFGQPSFAISSIQAEDVTTTSALVKWYTSIATSNVRILGEPAPQISSQGNWHEALFSNLSPDTTYSYTIQAGKQGGAFESSASLSFRTPQIPPNEPSSPQDAGQVLPDADASAEAESQTVPGEASAEMEDLLRQMRELQLKVVELARQLISLWQERIYAIVQRG